MSLLACVLYTTQYLPCHSCYDVISTTRPRRACSQKFLWRQPIAQRHWALEKNFGTTSLVGAAFWIVRLVPKDYLSPNALAMWIQPYDLTRHRDLTSSHRSEIILAQRSALEPCLEKQPEPSRHFTRWWNRNIFSEHKPETKKGRAVAN